MSKAYEQGYQKYRELLKASAEGNLAARQDKAKLRLELREMERSAAREGTILVEGQDVTEAITKQNLGKSPRRKKEMQREYCEKFDAEVTVKMAPKAGAEEAEVNLYAWHRKRLGV